MKPRAQVDGSKARLLAVNWIGVVTGILMLVLPFMGYWWHATVGTDAMILDLSPFDYNASIIGQSLTSPLVSYSLLAVKLTVLIGGAIMLAGSLGATRWWGKRLMRFGAMKVLWMVIGLVAILALGAFLANEFLPGIISGMGEGGGTIQLNIPYITGTATSAIQTESATITAPITMELTGVFWIAVVTAGFGVGARIYHRRLMKETKK